MKVYFFIISLCCLSYYGIIRHYTGKWNSTFAGFWFFSALLHGAGFLVWPYLPIFAQYIIEGILLIGWILFLWVEALILKGMKQKPVEDANYVIVLGAHVNGTVVTNSLKRRLDAAFFYAQNHPKANVIVSGGRGEGELITEAEAMANYLITSGLDPERIIQEVKSTTTEENLRFSAQIVNDVLLKTERQGEELQKRLVLIVTNNFHVYRSLQIAKQVGYEKAYGLAATSNEVLQLNYLVREFFALLWMEVRRIAG